MIERKFITKPFYNNVVLSKALFVIGDFKHILT